MLWILQKNLRAEGGYEHLAELLPRMGIDSIFVKVVPFSHKILPANIDAPKAVEIDDISEPEIDVSGDVWVMGSYTLAKIAQERNWKPGSFTENLDYLSYSQAWPDELLLNPKAQVSELKDAAFAEDKLAFVKPVKDSKSFTGQVFDYVEWENLKKRIAHEAEVAESIDMLPLKPDTLVLVSKPVEIYTESRMFVIDGKVVTGSLYKRGSRSNYDEDIDQEVLDFAQHRVDDWQPSKAFVIDVAQTPKGLKIIELNCINASGLYSSNVQKIVEAIEAIHEER